MSLLSFPADTGPVGLGNQHIGMIHNGYKPISYKFDWYFVANLLYRSRHGIQEFATETKSDLNTLVHSLVNDTLGRSNHGTTAVDVRQSEDWLLVNDQKVGQIWKDNLWPYPWKYIPSRSYAGPFEIGGFSASTREHVVTLARCWFTSLWRDSHQT